MFDTELRMRVWEIRHRIYKATLSMCSVDGFAYTLSFPELFASRRAGHLSKKVRAMWKTLCDLDPEQAVIQMPDSATRWILRIKDEESNEAYMQRRMDAANAGY